jgi:hypothetical protein
LQLWDFFKIEAAICIKGKEDEKDEKGKAKKKVFQRDND